jgi:hypothetical protein
VEPADPDEPGAWVSTATFDRDPRFVDEFGPDAIAGTFDDDLHLSPYSPLGDPARS